MKKTAVSIVRKLQQNGFEAYFAGGFVRDMLLHIESKDIDIVTSAKPSDIEKLFKKIIPVGKEFGILVVVENEKSFEVATFREEGKYLDKRRPSSISFTDAKHDALRRDFTINGLFYDPISKNIIDHVGGLEDIKKKTIRFIGDPDLRITEDNLRLIRAIRLKITLGFQYDNKTFEAIRKNADLINNVSAERIRDELNKILTSKNRHIGLIEMSESSLLKYLIPELEKLKGVPQPIEYHHEGDVFTHTYLALKSLHERAAEHLVWSVLLHDIGKPTTLIKENGRIIFHDHAKVSAQIARDILARLRFPKFEIYDISWLIENHMRLGLEQMRPSKRLEFVLDPKFEDLIELVRADSLGTYPKNLKMVKSMELNVKKAILWRKEHLIHEKKHLITGDDLIKLGLTPGINFKRILDEINDQVIEGKILSKNDAIEFLQKKYLK